MRSLKSLPLVLLAFALSCTTQTGSSGPSGTLLADRISIHTGDFPIPPGDSFTCFYTPFTAETDLTVTRGVGMQQEGGHHLTVYYTMTPQPAGYHTCTDQEMATWRQIAAADPTTGETSYAVPGLGMRVPAGAQIVVQAHYINLGDVRSVNDWVDVMLPRTGEVRYLAQSFVIDDEDWEVPAMGSWQSQSECVVSRDYQAASLLGHMHELGAHFTLEMQAPGETTWTSLYDTDWTTSYFSHPPINLYGLDTPLMMPAGTRLRQTCQWHNTTTDPAIFPREMCVTYMLTFPSTTGGMDLCDIVAHTSTAL